MNTGVRDAGTQRVTIATNDVVPVSDNSGSLTVDNAALSVTGGGVESSALRVTIASDSTGVLSVDDNAGSLTVDAPVGTPVNVQVGDGTNTATIRNLAANDALNVAIVDAAGDHITSFGGSTQYTEDAAAAADPVGTAPILVRKDTPATITSTDGDNVAQRGTNYGAAYVQVVTSSGSYVDSFGGGTQYTEDVASSADPVGTQLIARRRDSLSTETSTDGDNTAVNVTGKGELYVKHIDAIPVTDNASSLTVDNATLSVTGGGTEASALRVTIANNSTGTMTVNAGADFPAVAAPGVGIGSAVGAVILGEDTGGLARHLSCSTSGDLHIHDGGNTITVDGTVNVGTVTNSVQVIGPTPHDTAVSTNPVLVAGRGSSAIPTAVSADGDVTRLWSTLNGALMVSVVDDAGDSCVDGTNNAVKTVVSTAIPAGSNNIGDVDVLTVPAPLSTSGNGTAATALRVTIASDTTGVVAVTDNAGSLTVDNAGTFAVQATVAAGAANIAKAEDAASADADVGVPAMAVRKASPANTSGLDGDYEMLQMSAGRLWASATIDAAIPAGSNNIGDVDVLTLPALPSGTNNIGDVDVLTVPAPLNVTGGGTEASALRVTIASDSTGVVSVDDNGSTLSIDDGGGTITVDGSLTSVTTVGNITGNVAVNGTTAHDSPLTTDPVVIGARASTAIPTAVSGDGDVVRLWASRRGALQLSIVDGDGDSCMDDTNAALKTVVSTALPSGTNNIGDVDVLSLPALPAGSNNIGDVDVLTVPAPLSTSGNGTAATALRVTVASDSTGVLTVQQSTAANLKVDLSGTAANTTAILVKEQRPATSSVTSVAGSASSVSLLASTAGRFGACITNDSTAVLRVKLGTTASSTSYTAKLTGAIDGIWESAAGNARITEITA
jgi:hypothetical protein